MNHIDYSAIAIVNRLTAMDAELVRQLAVGLRMHAPWAFDRIIRECGGDRNDGSDQYLPRVVATLIETA